MKRADLEWDALLFVRRPPNYDTWCRKCAIGDQMSSCDIGDDREYLDAPELRVLAGAPGRLRIRRSVAMSIY